MAINRRSFLQCAIGSGLLSARTGSAYAQEYPSRGIRIIVGFPPGGPLDIAARVIASWLTEALKQPFSVENNPGESGNIATGMVVKADPDGSTLLLCGPVHTINTTLFDQLDFDFGRDIAPVASFASVPLVIEVNPSVAIRSPAEFIAYAKANPAKLRVAYAGNGTPQHIGIELFKMMAGANLTLVPYLGSAPALADLLVGKVDAMFDPLPSSVKLVKEGKLIPIAVTGLSRSEALPNVPAMADFVPGYAGGSWFGIGAPRDTPEAIVDTLNRAINHSFKDPGVAAKLAELGAAAMPGSADDLSSFIASETERYRSVIKTASIKRN